jgi:hypothetical protein
MTKVISTKKFNLQEKDFSILHLNLALGINKIKHVTNKNKDIILKVSKNLTKIEDLSKLLSPKQYKKIESVFYIPLKIQDPKEIIKNQAKEIKELKSQLESQAQSFLKIIKDLSK